MKIDRRQALTLVAIGAVPAKAASPHQGAHGAHGAAAQTASRQFFSEAEFAAVARVAELVIPSNSHSGGAGEARVAEHIDLVAANSSDSVKAAWKERLAAFLALARERFGAEFAQLSQRDQAALLDLVSANEQKPATLAEHFFAEMKSATLFAYYSSEIGLMKELGYKGNQVLDEFTGCPHEVGKHRVSS